MTSLVASIRAARPENAPLPQAGGGAAPDGRAHAAPSLADAAQTPADAAQTPSIANAAQQPAAACQACKGLLFWQNAYGNLLCERCHVPASQAMVRKRLFVDASSNPARFIDANSESGQAAIRAAEISARKNFPEPKLCDGCGGNIFWLGWDGKINCRSCRKIENAGDVQKIIFVCLNREFREVIGSGDDSTERKFIWGDKDWPPPRKAAEISSPEEIAYFAEMKKRREEWEEKYTTDPAVALASWKGAGSAGSPASTAKRKRR